MAKGFTLIEMLVVLTVLLLLVMVFQSVVLLVALLIVIAFLTSAVVSQTVQPFVGRPRPDVKEVIAGRPYSPGFPNGEAAGSSATFVLILLSPLYWAAVTSLKSQNQAYASPATLLPQTPNFQAYAHVVQTPGHVLLPSLLIAFGTAVLTLMIATPAAYALAHFRFRVTGVGIPVEVANSGNDTRWGGTVGVGLEYGFAPNWSAGVEYDHLFMGSRTYTLLNNGVAGVAGTVFDNARIRQDVDLVTVRVNYKFGGPVVARY